MTQSEPEAPEASPNGHEPAPSALDLRRDGTVGITMPDGTEVDLRRPTLGEFRRWRMRLNELNDGNRRMAAQEGQAAAADAEDEHLSPEERIIRAGERRMAADVAAEERSIDWWSEVIGTLSGEDTDPDRWPPFLLFAPDSMARTLEHWRAVPLAPGPRSNRST
jgi:hypothetical protein